jgi:hypothetical protein
MERTPGTHWIGGWVGLRANPAALATRKILCPLLGIKPVIQSTVGCYTDYATLAQKNVVLSLNNNKSGPLSLFVNPSPLTIQIYIPYVLKSKINFNIFLLQCYYYKGKRWHKVSEQVNLT